MSITWNFPSPLLTRFLEEVDPETRARITEMHEQGHGYKRIYRSLKKTGSPFSRAQIQEYLATQPRTVMSNIADIEDEAVEVPEDYFIKRGIEVPPEGMKLVAATVEERGAGGEKHWVRLKPEVDPTEPERVEIRQAQPVEVRGTISAPVLVSTEWQTWIANPDCQVGYWVDSNNVWHTIHDERCFSLGHQIAQHVAETEGLHGWLDVGDLADLAAPSRHNPTAIDIRVEGLNKTWQRLSEEFALRRFVVGEKGELVVLSGNHDLRLSSSAAQKEPWLVGMRRADSVGDEHPVLSVPYLSRAQDYGVEWVPSFPSGYRKLNSNLVAFHSPSYGSKALETARKIAAKVHMSVYHGHTHRREALAENIETDRGARTLEIWSDGTWARIDGSLPGASSTRDEYGNRLMAGRLVNEKWGVLTPSMHQGLSIIHVEVGGRERFSAERIAFWDGWAQFRGKEFASAVDAEGNPHA